MSTRRRGIAGRRRQPVAGISASRLARALARISACRDFARAGRLPLAHGAGCAGHDQALEPSGCRGVGSYAIREAWALSGSTRSSWLREVMSSLVNTLRRW